MLLLVAFFLFLAGGDFIISLNAVVKNPSNILEWAFLAISILLFALSYLVLLVKKRDFRKEGARQVAKQALAVARIVLPNDQFIRLCRAIVGSGNDG